MVLLILQLDIGERTRDFAPNVGYCDGRPTLTQHWASFSCLLRCVCGGGYFGRYPNVLLWATLVWMVREIHRWGVMYGQREGLRQQTVQASDQLTPHFTGRAHPISTTMCGLTHISFYSFRTLVVLGPDSRLEQIFTPDSLLQQMWLKWIKWFVIDAWIIK